MKNHKIKYFRPVAALLVMILLASQLTACATYDNFYKTFLDRKGQTEEKVRIGVFEPMTGLDKDKGALEIMGIELAHDLYPQALKKDVELIYADNQSDIYVAESAIQDLIEKRPSVVLGSYGNAYSLIAAKYLEEAQIPAIAITNTNPLVTQNHDFYFRVCFVESYHGVAVAKYAVNELHAKGAAILTQSGNDEADAICQVFSDKMVQLTENESAIVTTQNYKPGNQDFTSQLEAIQASGTNIVFMPIPLEDAGLVMRQAKQMDLNFVFLGTSDWESETLIRLAGEDAVGNVAFATAYDAEATVTEMSRVFLDAYHEKYGEESTPDPAVAMGFDAYVIAIESLNTIGTALDGDLMRLSIFIRRQFQGASGEITFDEHGDPIKSVAIKGIRNGKFENIYIMEPKFEPIGR